MSHDIGNEEKDEMIPNGQPLYANCGKCFFFSFLFFFSSFLLFLTPPFLFSLSLFFLSLSLFSLAITGMDTCARKPLVVTCGIDRYVRVWNYLTKKKEVNKIFPEDALSVSFHPSGLHILVGFSDKLRLMNLLMDDIRVVAEFPIKVRERERERRRFMNLFFCVCCFFFLIFF